MTVWKMDMCPELACGEVTKKEPVLHDTVNWRVLQQILLFSLT